MLTSEKDENRISPGKSRAEELREDKRGERRREQERKKREGNNLRPQSCPYLFCFN